MNLKLTTLNRAMKTLEQRKLIISSGEMESTGGRKAATYDVTHQDLYLIGIDLSRTYVKIGLTNLKLSVLKTDEFFLNEQYSAEKTISTILFLIERMMQEKAISKNQVLGIGVGTVGPLDRKQGIMLSPPGFLNQDWGDVPLKERIESNLSMPCFVDNGANVAVLAEYLFGMGNNKRSVAYIHCGIGIRSAVIKDGLIIRTMNDREDAFGNMTILLQESGRAASIEGVSALGAVIHAITAELKLGSDELHEGNYQEVLSNLPRENKAIQKIIHERAEFLSIGLANFSRLLNPDVIILSGPLMINLEEYYQACIDAFYRNYHFADTILFSKGGVFQENTIAIGSAAMVMDSCCKAKIT
jgi:predicted NBD/HSP70 family sugar kinase